MLIKEMNPPQAERFWPLEINVHGFPLLRE
jgi:hypothetical protein